MDGANPVSEKLKAIWAAKSNAEKAAIGARISAAKLAKSRQQSRFILDSGSVFGQLQVVRAAELNETILKIKKPYLCVCSCGNTCFKSAYKLLNGVSRSCGCSRGQWAVKHGNARGTGWTTEYRIRSMMLQRCLNPNNPAFKDYGGRGITVCERWRNSFEAFLSDVGRRPSPKHSLDRYPDKDGNYEPGNVRWATAKQQMRNVRSNMLLTMDGETHPASEWAEIYGMNYYALLYRLKKRKMPLSEALSSPLRSRPPRCA